MRVSVSEAIYLLVCLVSYTLVRYLMAGKEKLAYVLCLKEVAVLAYTNFVGRGRCGCRVSHGLHYYPYPFPSSYNLKDTVAFVYQASFAIVEQPPEVQEKLGGTGCLRNQ